MVKRFKDFATPRDSNLNDFHGYRWKSSVTDHDGSSHSVYGHPKGRRADGWRDSDGTTHRTEAHQAYVGVHRDKTGKETKYEAGIEMNGRQHHEKTFTDHKAALAHAEQLHTKYPVRN